MDARINTDPTLRSVEADFYYLAPMAELPHTYRCDPPSGVPRTNAINEPHRMAAHDVRQIGPDISLDREGFALVRQQSAVRDSTTRMNWAASITPTPSAWLQRQPVQQV
jgi:hypothetical protein